jgi:hypothetical protein
VSLQGLQGMYSHRRAGEDGKDVPRRQSEVWQKNQKRKSGIGDKPSSLTSTTARCFGGTTLSRLEDVFAARIIWLSSCELILGTVEMV